MWGTNRNKQCVWLWKRVCAPRLCCILCVGNLFKPGFSILNFGVFWCLCTKHKNANVSRYAFTSLSDLSYLSTKMQHKCICHLMDMAKMISAPGVRQRWHLHQQHTWLKLGPLGMWRCLPNSVKSVKYLVLVPGVNNLRWFF